MFEKVVLDLMTNRYINPVLLNVLKMVSMINKMRWDLIMFIYYSRTIYFSWNKHGQLPYG